MCRAPFSESRSTVNPDPGFFMSKNWGKKLQLKNV
jgi:hypothetical protein